jgi:copper oxidase (laccase) domain-containing protein
MFEKEKDSLLLNPAFPALAGITNCWAGDFGYGNFETERMGEEYRASRLLARALCGDFSYAKIIPEHGDRLILAESFDGYARTDGLINFTKKEKKEPGVLFSVTADCPTIVFATADQNLIAIVHSGWKGCQLKIAEKTVDRIGEKTGIIPQNLFAGIFPGICGKCFEVKDDVGLLFPEFYKDGRLNLTNIILNQLSSTGVIPEKIFLAPYCSHCTEGAGSDPFFSYRRDKTAKRNAVFIIRRNND